MTTLLILFQKCMSRVFNYKVRVTADDYLYSLHNICQLSHFDALHIVHDYMNDTGFTHELVEARHVFL